MVLYLDFDGVLHDDAVFFRPDRGIYMGTPGRTLFEWTPILEELLAPHPEVQIVLSTSWVRQRSYAFAKAQLPVPMQARVIGATFHNREIQKLEFDLMSRGAQVLADVERRRAGKWFAIDNDAAGWPDYARGCLVLTTDRLGLSEARVQDEVKALLESEKQQPVDVDVR